MENSSLIIYFSCLRHIVVDRGIDGDATIENQRDSASMFIGNNTKTLVGRLVTAA